jgi:hypothetical protein
MFGNSTLHALTLSSMRKKKSLEAVLSKQQQKKEIGS